MDDKLDASNKNNRKEQQKQQSSRPRVSFNISYFSKTYSKRHFQLQMDQKKLVPLFHILAPYSTRLFRYRQFFQHDAIGRLKIQQGGTTGY